MRKLVCIVTACMILAFVSTSCNKRCVCKTYVAGIVTETEDGVEIDSDVYDSCSDLDNYNDTFNSGIKCEPDINIFD